MYINYTLYQDCFFIQLSNCVPRLLKTFSDSLLCERPAYFCIPGARPLTTPDRDLTGDLAAVLSVVMPSTFTHTALLPEMLLPSSPATLQSPSSFFKMQHEYLLFTPTPPHLFPNQD